MKLKSSCYAWLVAAVVLTACHGRRTYHHYQTVDAERWAMTDTLRFVPEHIEYEGLYVIGAGARVNDRYPYRNLWLVVEKRTLAEPRTAHRDTLNLILADSEGAWLTQGVVLHEAEETVDTTRLKADEEYEFLVYHIMNEQELKGVTDVGITLLPN